MTQRPVPLHELLEGSFDIGFLRNEADRLDVEDLRALGSFATQPHPLVHRVVASATVMLLSIAPTHANTDGNLLHVKPWAMLRFELLTDPLALWRRMRSRVRELETGDYKLSPAQIEFVCVELLQLLIEQSSGVLQETSSFQQEIDGKQGEMKRNRRGTRKQNRCIHECSDPVRHLSNETKHGFVLRLDMLSRVSTIAAALGAWICLCLYVSCQRRKLGKTQVSPIKIKLEPHILQNNVGSHAHLMLRADSGSHRIADSPPKSCLVVLRSHNPAPRARIMLQPPKAVARSLLPVKSIRRPLKVGGRYVMFHVRMDRDAQQISWSLLCLDKGVLYREVSAPNQLRWTPFHSLALYFSNHADGTLCSLLNSTLPQTALECILVQLACHTRLLPSQPLMPRFLSPPLHNVVESSIDLQLHILVAQGKPRGNLKPVQASLTQDIISFVGLVMIQQCTSISNLRKLLATKLSRDQTNTFRTGVSLDNFRFLYRGSALPLEHEEHMPAIALLPATVLLSPMMSFKFNFEPAALSVVAQLERDVARLLRNCGVEHLILSDEKLAEVEVVAINHSIFGKDSGTEWTAPAVTEILRNWRSFIQMQQLQHDSTTIIQIPRKKKKSPSKRRSLGFYIALNLQNAIPRPEVTTPQLPHQKFNQKNEFLMPLYATVNVTSPTGLVMRPLLPNNMQPGMRLALFDEFHVIHVLSIQRVDPSTNKAFGNDSGDLGDAFLNGDYHILVKFERDMCCPRETLENFRGVYVWAILPRTKLKDIAMCLQRDRKTETWPPEWLCAIYRYVTHPVIEYNQQQYCCRFRVKISMRQAERELEGRFWSKGVNWEAYLLAEDIQEQLLTRTYELLCHSHPPSFAIDSVKFSKLLRECGVQPQFLDVGDAAFLFMSNLTPGSRYEMVFDGFQSALEQVSVIMYPCSESALKHFCFYRLVHAPSLLMIWKDIIDKWRRKEKLSLMNDFAGKYCAATRIQALWKQIQTRRIHISALDRMKEERCAAIKIQSVFRMCRIRKRFAYLRYRAEQVQVRFKARRYLRDLRKTRLEFIERMRVRIVRWMKQRLGVLRAWKQINARWVVRRDRIWAKRQRLLAATACYLETQCFRIYLYISDCASFDVNLTTRLGFELCIVNSENSLCLVSLLLFKQVAAFQNEYKERQLHFTQFFSADRLLDIQHRSQIDFDFNLQNGLVQDSQQPRCTPASWLRRPKPRPNSILNAITARIRGGQQKPEIRFFSNSVLSSLGKLVFYGVVRSNLDPSHEGDSSSNYRVVKVLQHADAFTLILFAPSVATTTRFDVTANFILRVLYCMQFNDASLSRPVHELNAGSAYISSVNDNAMLTIHNILRGAQRINALRHIVAYLVEYHAAEPQIEMTPEVKARLSQIDIEKQQRIDAVARAREMEIIVSLQTHARQRLARRTRKQLALTRYRKQFDRSSNTFLYILTAKQGNHATKYKHKPFSLFDDDVEEPPDEWKAVLDHASSHVLYYTNYYRGLDSPYNEDTASRVLQRWFRRLMLCAIKPWGLRELVVALQFHRDIEKPLDELKLTPETDVCVVKNAKLHAMQLHTLHHDYKSAFARYESLVKVTPRDPELLMCFAVLLIASCRYPVKQTWARAQILLQEALDANGGPSMDRAFLYLEDVCFGWALFLHPRNPEAIVNYAVFLQCVRHEMDKAELLYRRGLDYSPTNERIVENYKRLRSERAPGGLYEAAGPGKYVIARAREISRHGYWREMENTSALVPAARQFFVNVQTNMCVWTRPPDYPG